jgi:hypothetical protein
MEKYKGQIKWEAGASRPLIYTYVAGWIPVELRDWVSEASPADCAVAGHVVEEVRLIS